MLFVLWCAVLLSAAALSAAFAWDPFADGSGAHRGPAERTHHHGAGGGFWGFGPSHK